jgi:hypothetical protein
VLPLIGFADSFAMVSTRPSLVIRSQSWGVVGGVLSTSIACGGRKPLLEQHDVPPKHVPVDKSLPVHLSSTSTGTSTEHVTSSNDWTVVVSKSKKRKSTATGSL